MYHRAVDLRPPWFSTIPQLLTSGEVKQWEQLMTDKSGAKLCKHNCVYSFFFVSPVFVLFFTPFLCFFAGVFLKVFLFVWGGGRRVCIYYVGEECEDVAVKQIQILPCVKSESRVLCLYYRSACSSLVSVCRMHVQKIKKSFWTCTG